LIRNLQIDGNAISSTNVDGNVVLDPNGAGAVSVSGANIENVADPVNAQDAATKAYVDARAAGLDPKASVRVATTTSLDLTTDLTNGNTVDGVTLATGDRVLVKNHDNVQLASTVAGDGLSYNSGVLDVGGTTDRITVDGTSVDIASTYAGQTSITTLGTITTGTWQGDTIAPTSGGTGFSTYSKGDLIYSDATDSLDKLAAGATGTVLQINATGEPVWGDIDGGTY